MNNAFEITEQLKQSLDQLNHIMLGKDSENVVIDGRVKPTISKDIADKFLNAMAQLESSIDGKFETLTLANGWQAFKTTQELLNFIPPEQDNNIIAYSFEDKMLYLWDGHTWINEGVSQSQYVISLGSLERNRGALYPFAVRERMGLISANNVLFSNFVLGVRVINAQLKTYYKIEYFQNGAFLNNSNEYNWIITQFEEVSYATDENRKILASYTGAYPKQPQIVPNTGIQTIILDTIGNSLLKFAITVDTNALPPQGKFITSINPDNDGYSHIIDPSCYSYFDETIYRGIAQANLLPNSLTLNKGKSYPNIQMMRNSVISKSNTLLDNCILKCEVHNAKPGALYHIGYYSNRSTALTGAKDAWIIQELNGIDDPSPINITELKDDFTDIPRSGIQTVIVKTKSPYDTFLKITMDMDSVPPEGYYFNMLPPDNDGYSHIIDPSCYSYFDETIYRGIAQANELICIDNKDLGGVECIFLNKNLAFKVIIAPTGFNNLPNIHSIYYKSLPGEIDIQTLIQGQWTQIGSYSTDWLPPLIVKAVNNGDGWKKVYTGGNHGSSGGASELKTATNNTFTWNMFNCSPVTDNIYRCSSITFSINNSICAYNTCGASNTQTHPPRYVLEQEFLCTVNADGNIAVNCNVTATEEIEMDRDNGVQCVSQNMNKLVMFTNSQFNTFVPSMDVVNSGAFSQFPHANITYLKGEHVGLVSYMDRNFGACAKPYTRHDLPLMYRGSGQTSKFYHSVIQQVAVSLQKSDSYQWRGGYHLVPNYHEDEVIVNLRKGSNNCVTLIKNNATNVEQ